MERIRDRIKNKADLEKCGWSDWVKFPDPKNGDYLNAPYGPGVYQLKNTLTKEFILFGRSKNTAFRMTSLLPGQCGGRKNTKKRDYIKKHIANIKYRTVACKDEDEAKRTEQEIKKFERYLKSSGKKSLHIYTT